MWELNGGRQIFPWRIQSDFIPVSHQCFTKMEKLLQNDHSQLGHAKILVAILRTRIIYFDQSLAKFFADKMQMKGD